MTVSGLQPTPEGEAPDPSVRFLTRVSPERLVAFDRLLNSGDFITAVMAALEREKLEATEKVPSA